MTAFNGWGTMFQGYRVSWVQGVPDSFLIDSVEWKAELAFRPPSGCEHGTPVREPYFSEILITVAEDLVLRTPLDGCFQSQQSQKHAFSVSNRGYLEIPEQNWPSCCPFC